MSKPVIIVESPAKTKTLKNFLGGEYDVRASAGHVRDLPKSKLGVDIENDFKPSYVISPDRKKVVSELKKAVEGAKEVFLASDPDREGEAISWHLAEALKLEDAKRIEFNEITKQAVTEALKRPRKIDEKRVGAQQARRVLDRLVGYQISPLLWSKVRKNLSAGRVQSVAVRLICEREREIEAFVPVEYWSLTATLTPLTGNFPFEAALSKIEGKKAEVSNEIDARKIADELKQAEYRVEKITRSERKRNAPAPFITSTLQQEASRKLGFTANKTMSIAQSLYEGVELGEEGSVGLITYMRTDSTRVAAEAVAECRDYVTQIHGSEYLPAQARSFNRPNNAQDAHEAIRPTSVWREPEKIKEFLSTDQLKLYRLIWLRFVASQMSPAVYDVESVDISAGKYTLRATGSVEKFKGFRVLYIEGSDDAPKQMDDEDRPPLPKLSEKEELKLLELKPEQHFTEPPPRFTEASLVKALEENGIGRPSTYASIISTIKDRKYVELTQKRFFPTELGFKVTDLLVKHFPSVLDIAFTAKVETQLDDVEQGRQDWVDLLRNFYGPFEKDLEEAKANMEQVKIEPKETDQSCPNCGRKMVIREGPYGPFIACSGYPECKTILKEQKTTGVTCPKCGKGEILERKSKKQKIFYGCNKYPDCDFVSWDRPTGENCPVCGGFLVEKVTKSRGHEVRCIDRACKYSRKAEDEETEGIEAA